VTKIVDPSGPIRRRGLCAAGQPRCNSSAKLSANPRVATAPEILAVTGAVDDRAHRHGAVQRNASPRRPDPIIAGIETLTRPSGARRVRAGESER
jgi:hypothetical protein